VSHPRSSISKYEDLAERRQVVVATIGEDNPIFAVAERLNLTMCGPVIGLTCRGDEHLILVWLKFHVFDPTLYPGDPDYIDLQLAMLYNEKGQFLRKIVDGQLLTDLDPTITVLPHYGALIDLPFGIQEDGLAVSRSWLEKDGNRDATLLFLKASLKGWLYCRDNPKR
jgi:hypothetical protein